MQPNKASPKIVVIGSANVDFVMLCPRLPVVGETVTGCDFLQVFGGKGANQAVAAARAGGSVEFVGAVGDDPYAARLVDGLVESGVGVADLAREQGVASGMALVMVAGAGANYLTVAPGSNHRVTVERVRRAEPLIAAADWVVLQMEVPRESVEEALRIAARHGRPVLLNHAPTTEGERGVEPAATCLVVNETEAAALLGETVAAGEEGNATRAAETLRTRGGHRHVVITLGGSGLVHAGPDGTARTPAFRISSVDTTAAGDTFCGALAVGLGEGRSFNDALRFASAAAALCCMGAGAQPSIPTRERIDAFLATA